MYGVESDSALNARSGFEALGHAGGILRAVGEPRRNLSAKRITSSLLKEPGCRVFHVPPQSAGTPAPGHFVGMAAAKHPNVLQ